MQNKLYLSRDDALNSPTASLDLTLDATGLVYNQLFDSSIVHYDHTYQNDQGFSAHFQSHLQFVCNFCLNYLTSVDSLIVDIGCGKGGFVDVLRSNGYNAIGYDNTYQGDSPYIYNSFFSLESHHCGDLLTLRHVLEHIPSPWDFLDSIALSNDYQGHLYIEVPDLDWILQHKAYFDLFHEHVNYFTIDDFLRRFGSGVVAYSRSFGGQYLSIVIKLSSFRQVPLASFPPPSTTHNLINSFIQLSQLEASAYSSLNKYKDCVLWGAASKGVIFAAKCPTVMKSKLRYAIDINPSKHGYFMPLSGLEVLDPKSGIASLSSDTGVIILNPNYQQEICVSLPSSQPFMVLS